MERFTRNGETIKLVQKGEIWYVAHENEKGSELLVCGSHKECVDMLGLLYRYLIKIK